MRLAPPFAAILTALATPAFAQAPAAPQPPSTSPDEPQRQLGAHVHGAGKLAIAIERRTVEIELEAPGSDIVGFEHAAQTAEQKQAVSQARATFTKPLGLIRFPEAAGCKVASAKVKLVGGGAHDHGHAHNHGKQAQGKADAHSEFHAEYKFNCAKPELVRTIDLDYFKAFPRAEKLDVEFVSDKTQTKAVATRDKPRVELKR